MYCTYTKGAQDGCIKIMGEEVDVNNYNGPSYDDARATARKKPLTTQEKTIAAAALICVAGVLTLAGIGIGEGITYALTVANITETAGLGVPTAAIWSVFGVTVASGLYAGFTPFDKATKEKQLPVRIAHAVEQERAKRIPIITEVTE